MTCTCPYPFPARNFLAERRNKVSRFISFICQQDYFSPVTKCIGLYSKLYKSALYMLTIGKLGGVQDLTRNVSFYHNFHLIGFCRYDLERMSFCLRSTHSTILSLSCEFCIWKSSKVACLHVFSMAHALSWWTRVPGPGKFFSEWTRVQ